MKQEDQ
jgi:hypothetical protein